MPVRQSGHSGSTELGKEQDGEGDAPLRSLFFFLAFNGITMWGEHIPGKNNGAADALSQ